MKLFLLSFFCFTLTLFFLNFLSFPEDTIEFDHPTELIYNATDILNSEPISLPLQTALEEAELEQVELKKEEKKEKQNKVIFRYKPKRFEKVAEESFKNPISQTLESPFFSSKINEIVIIFYEKRNKIRGNMKNKVLRLYDPDRIGETETLAVFLHELAHYIDLYYLKKEDGYDLSYEFYAISWLNTKISHPGQTEKDFVSGYASSNAYEDFSESFLYFVFHNTEFQKKADENENLQKKYDFFKNILFSSGEFQNTSFSRVEHDSYTRDITKLDFSIENFLDYLKKSI